jgi:hypothetical protein
VLLRSNAPSDADLVYHPGMVRKNVKFFRKFMNEGIIPADGLASLVFTVNGVANRNTEKYDFRVTSSFTVEYYGVEYPSMLEFMWHLAKEPSMKTDLIKRPEIYIGNRLIAKVILVTTPTGLSCSLQGCITKKKDAKTAAESASQRTEPKSVDACDVERSCHFSSPEVSPVPRNSADIPFVPPRNVSGISSVSSKKVSSFEALKAFEKRSPPPAPVQDQELEDQEPPSIEVAEEMPVVQRASEPQRIPILQMAYSPAPAPILQAIPSPALDRFQIKELEDYRNEMRKLDEEYNSKKRDIEAQLALFEEEHEVKKRRLKAEFQPYLEQKIKSLQDQLNKASQLLDQL